MIRFVHLSDFHLSMNSINDAENFIIKSLIKDMVSYHKKKEIDFIMFSGDLIDKGGKSFDDSIEMALLTFEDKVIKPILRNLKIENHKFLFCPGNHDIEREADEDFEDEGLCAKLTCTENVNEFINSKKDTGIKRVLKFKEFEKAFHKSYPNKHNFTNFQSTYKSELDSIKIGISCLNTSWRCFDSQTDKGKILLGEDQLIKSREIISECDLKIALLHHPIEWLADFDLKSIREIFQRDYDIVFQGHTHEGEAWVNTSYYGGLFVSVAPSNWTYNIRQNKTDCYNGYSIIDYDLNAMKITVHNRKYYHKKEKFDPDIERGDEKGIAIYQIPNSNQLTTIYEETKIATSLEEVYFDSINEHLLTYNTDTRAPKKIDELFVQPKMVSKVIFEDSEEKSEYYTLEEILENDCNTIIYGSKESGKTILLDKLFIESTKNIYKYGRVPVLFDYQIVKGKRYETIINRFLHIGIHSVENFLIKHKIVFLIDNISFNENDNLELEKLRKFVESFPDIRIIASCHQFIEGSIPVSHLSHEFYQSFKSIQIQSFKTKEIKTLIRLWFSSNEYNVTPIKFDKIIEFFSTLNLPRTPLAISMFLWIIEQQENYRPINHAVMLENFIERLFKKLSKKEIYSDVFDYTNKIRLLSEIAKEMLDKELPNYRMLYHDLNNFIYSYLKDLRFDFVSDDVLKHFLTKGILIKEIDESEVFVRFRFKCFFQYFLMKYMDYNSEFLKEVMEEENYLFFVNEIDYLTGLKRDCSDILKTVVDRMVREFQEPMDIINGLSHTYDSVFMGQETIINNVPDDIIKKLPSTKPNEKEIEKITDEFLETIKPEKGIRKKKREISPINKLERFWTLSAKVLKNTEEIKIPNLKDDAYEKIIKASLAFASLYRYYIERYFENNEAKSKVERDLYASKDFIPLLNEMALFTLIGTKKLSVVIRDKIKGDLKKKGISDIEKFTSVFLYADIQGNDYHKFLNSLIKNVRQNYIFDMILFKIVSYYYFRSSDKKTDKIFLNLIGDLLVKARGEKKIIRGKVFESYTDKGKIIQHYVERKRDKKKDTKDPEEKL